MNPIFRFGTVAIATVLLAGCALMAPPKHLDLGLSKPGTRSIYQVTMHPPPEAATINQIHAWEVEVKTMAGEPVADASICFSGGMPQHFHGFPTSPQVTDNLGNGKYVLDGVKFSMSGWWQMKLQIDAAQGSDVVEFNTVVPERAPTTTLAGRP
jgi:hypothetical protein